MRDSKVSRRIRQALQEFTKHLESGRLITERFCVTKLIRQEDGTVKRITSGPTKGAKPAPSP